MPGPHLSADPESTRPLTARSVVLSLLLGSHPEPLSSAGLVAAAGLFGLTPATTRVALSRAVTAGDVERSDAGHLLGPRLRARQARQEQALAPRLLDWDGIWETAVVVVSGLSSAGRSQLRDDLASYRLAELRPGVWMRPANLARPRSYVEDASLRTFLAEPVEQDADELAAALWDLDEWATTGARLISALESATHPADRFLGAARIVRHLVTDPILPDPLLPPGWPGRALRESYADYQRELRDVALARA